MDYSSAFARYQNGHCKGQYLSPSGRLIANFEQLEAEGCDMAYRRDRFDELMKTTRGNPCYGCARWKVEGPSCSAFQKYHTAFRGIDRVLVEEKDPYTPNNVSSGPLFGMTVREIAKHLDVSISEVRRRKLAGTLADPPELAAANSLA